MNQYLTSEEAAKKLEQTIRQVQNLCKSGKLRGAFKQGGVWLIPKDSVHLFEKKSVDAPYSGRKKNIFKKAIELFANNAYEVVTMQDIADAVGIRQSGLYNHFESKQEILNAAYNFYEQYSTKDRPSIKELESVIENEPVAGFINSLYFEFDDSYQETLILCTKLIFQRAFIDERAKQLYSDILLTANIGFVEDFFDKAIELKRIAPFDAHAMSVFIVMNRIYFFMNWLTETSAEKVEELINDQNKLNQYALSMLTDLKGQKSD